MVKFILLITISLLLLESCCFKGTRTIYGYPRKNIKIKNSIGKNVLHKIDIGSLYELQYRVSNTGELFPNQPDENGRIFLKFYMDNKVGQFIGVGKDSINDKYSDTIKRNDFNPEKSKMGYYREGDNYLEVILFGTKFCNFNRFQSKMFINKDTLKVHTKSDKLFGSWKETYIYIKSDIKNNLHNNWTPDW